MDKNVGLLIMRSHVQSPASHVPEWYSGLFSLINTYYIFKTYRSGVQKLTSPGEYTPCSAWGPGLELQSYMPHHGRHWGGWGAPWNSGSSSLCLNILSSSLKKWRHWAGEATREWPSHKALGLLPRTHQKKEKGKVESHPPILVIGGQKSLLTLLGAPDQLH